MLGLIVEKVFGKSIADLTAEKLLQPMGAERDALWLFDGSEKYAKTFCCYNGVAQDYARFGHLILNNGSWNGKQLVPEAYMKEATTPALFLQDPTEGFSPSTFRPPLIKCCGCAVGRIEDYVFRSSLTTRKLYVY
jgi:CubicO group peptidase (beta-lactamase class C family)